METQSIEAPTIPKRPHYRDPDILREAAKRMTPDLRRHFEGNEDEAIWDALTTAMKAAFSLDGYEIARELEDEAFVEPNADMVADLDSAYPLADQVANEAIKEWVQKHNVVLKRKVGDRVKCRHGVGVINGVKAELAYYLFKPDSSTKFQLGGGIHVFEDELEDATPADGAAQ
jgi:hypothetical protein